MPSTGHVSLVDARALETLERSFARIAGDDGRIDAVVHAPSSVPWVALPLVGYATERLLGLQRRGNRSVALSAEALRSGVTRLDLAPPPGFRFAPGDYVFLRVPATARRSRRRV